MNHARQATASKLKWPSETPPRSTDSSAEHLLRLIHWSSAAGRQLRRQLADIAEQFELSDGELLVVWLCRDTDWVQVELAAALGVSPAHMSGIVERLGTRGLVAMHRPSIDRRRQVWRTTDDGIAFLDRLAPRLEELAASLGDGISADDYQAASTLCQRLAEATTSGKATLKRELADTHDLQHAGKEAA
jgi:DNA-binding MarR family transcriptional regulator